MIPAPDHLDFVLAEKHTCLITDDGTPLTPALAQSLKNLGWPVVILRLPAGLVACREELPDGAAVVELAEMSEHAIEMALAQSAGEHGPAAAFIHLAPGADPNNAQALAFPEGEKSLLKLAFLAAKHLKPGLSEAAACSRAIFMTVTCLDGEFGLSGDGQYSPVSGGLFGLVKTLNLEWEAVFCRAVDLCPTLAVEQAVAHIVAELHDPNLLITEAGYNANNERSTLVLANVPVTGGAR